MVIKYEVTVDDSLAFVRHHWKFSQAFQARRQRNMLIVAVALTAVVLAPPVFDTLFAGDITYATLFAWAGGLLTYFGLAIAGSGQKALLRQMFLENGGSATYGSREIEFADAGLIYRTSNSELRLPWLSVRRIDETPERVFIYIAPVEAIILPRQSIASSVLDEALAVIRSRCAPPSPPTQPGRLGSTV